MPNIDFDALLTAENVADAARQERRSVLRTECHARISAQLSLTDQANLAAAMATGQLSPAEKTHYRTALDWIVQMRAVWPRMAEGDTKLDWPEVPHAAIDALQSRF